MFLLLMVLYFFANTAARLLSRVFSRNTTLDPYAASMAIVVPTYFFGAMYGLTMQDGQLLQGVTLPIVLLALVVGLAEIGFGRVALITQRHVDAASFTVLRMSVVPVAVLFSTVFFGETLSLLQLVGMICILLGVTIVGTNGRVPRLKHFGKYELMTILSGVYLALFIMISRYVVDQTSIATLLVVFAGIVALPNTVFVLARSRKSLLRQSPKLPLLIGIASTAHIVTFWSAVELIDNVALVSSISAFRIVTIFVAGYLLLKEKDNLQQKLAGSVLATVGLLLS